MSSIIFKLEGRNQRKLWLFLNIVISLMEMKRKDEEKKFKYIIF